MHIVENATLAFGPDVYNTHPDLFHNLPVRLGEILLMAALVYHSLNGLRVDRDGLLAARPRSPIGR